MQEIIIIHNDQNGNYFFIQPCKLKGVVGCISGILELFKNYWLVAVYVYNHIT